MSGNPIKSILVNNFIKSIKKAEVQKLGKESQAKRPVTVDEYKKMLQVLRTFVDPIWKYALPALFSFQFHTVARIDDSCQFMMNKLVHHDQFPFALKARMRWSKNVLEERSAPPQILMGSNDPDFYVLLNLGLFLEQMYQVGVDSNGQINYFSAISKSATNSKTRVSKIMKRKIFPNAAFKDIHDA